MTSVSADGEAKKPADEATPLFLFSMPRSGSTLLQRMLATHPAIATGPEPTFLLPLLHIGTSSNTFATYDQRYTAMAVEDFLASTDGGQETFDEMVRGAASKAYAVPADSGATYFLDKTPKYHMVSDDVLRIFADSPAIVLWRNPLAVVASILRTWGKRGGRWNIHHFRLDLFHALPKLIDVAKSNADRLIVIRYEDLVTDPDGTMTKLFEYLNLSIDDADVSAFGSVELVGRVQDPNVSREGFASVRTDRTEGWAGILNNPLRKAWSKRYLKWLGADRMEAMGYDLDATLASLDALPVSTKYLASDAALIPSDTFYRVFEVEIFKSKIRSFLAGDRPLLAHK